MSPSARMTGVARVFPRVVPPRVHPRGGIVSNRDALCAPHVPTGRRSGRSNYVDEEGTIRGGTWRVARVFRRVVPPQRVDPPSSVVSSRDARCAPQVPSYSQSGRSNVADECRIAVNALPCRRGRRGGVDDADGDILP